MQLREPRIIMRSFRRFKHAELSFSSLLGLDMLFLKVWWEHSVDIMILWRESREPVVISFHIVSTPSRYLGFVLASFPWTMLQRPHS